MRARVEARTALFLVLLAIAVPVTAQNAPTNAPTRYAGRLLADVLQTLQSQGLRIIFTSNVVTSDLRVLVEPHAATPRAQLDEILAPHRLEARKGPGGTLQIVRAPRVRTATSSCTPPQVADDRTRADAAPSLRLYDERITVKSPPWWEPAAGVSEETVIRHEITSMTRDVVDDPLRAIQSVPRVAPLGDFRSEFVVRASPFRHAEVIVDGISTSWLRHAPDQSASVSIFTAALVDSATLRAGAYPRTYGERLGPQLELTLREGSREHFHVQGTIANTASTLVAEGPIGQARGSWITAARLSTLEWPGEHLSSNTPFGFSDALGKIVFDVSPRHQLGFSVIAGRSRVDAEEDVEASSSAATAHAAVASLSWRSVLGPATVFTQRAAVIRQGLAGAHSDTPDSAFGADEELMYHGTMVRRTRFGVLESGGQVSRTTWQRDGLPSATSWTQAGYVHLEWQGTERLTISPGVRVSGASRVPGASISPWLLGEFRAGRRWTISASTGLSHQFPDMDDPARVLVAGDAAPESALNVDIGVRQQLTSSVHWGATAYQRQERGVLDEHAGSLAGVARGVEIVLERRSSSGLSGWAAYAFGRARQHPSKGVGGGETFWADFDQRHSLIAFGAYRWRDTTSVGATLRVGTGTPIAGYLSSRGEGLFLGERRNDLRLPSYSRFDIRAERGFQVAGRRFQGFVEVVNVLDRTNVGPSVGTFGVNGEAIGFVERVAPRRASAGVMFVF